jgi:hypothetical protein
MEKEWLALLPATSAEVMSVEEFIERRRLA